MAINDLYSKRQKRAKGEAPDVFVYDEIPYPLRVQLWNIFQEGMGGEGFRFKAEFEPQIQQILCHEYGMFSLDSTLKASNSESQLKNHLLHCDDVARFLDCVELYLQNIERIRHRPQFFVSLEDVISETNARFKEHGVGYQYASGQIIRIDSTFIHAEVMIPTLSLLCEPCFKGANDEFLKAHEHYRHCRHKECLNECLKAFESTMKTICDVKGWTYQPTDTAKKLVDTCHEKGLFASFMQSHIGSLRSLLESGVPTTRNKLSGHGQGTDVVDVPESTARFVLHSTASNILFLIESMGK